MNRKILYIFVLGLVLLATGCTPKNENIDALEKISQRGKLIVGTKFDTKPFGFIDEKGQLSGFDVDLAKIIAKNILGDENKIEFIPVTSANRMLALSSGKVDMVIATMTITNPRKRIIDFSVPYYMAGQAVLVPKNSDISSVSDLNGKNVIIVFGSTAEDNLRLRAPEANIIGFKTYTSAYNALKQGKADAMTSDDTILMGFAQADNSVKILPRRYTKEPYAIGFKKSEISLNLENKVNAILETMVRDGELKTLKNKWIKD